MRDSGNKVVAVAISVFVTQIIFIVLQRNKKQILRFNLPITGVLSFTN